MRTDKTRRQIVEMVEAQRRAEYDRIDAVYAPILNALYEDISDAKLIAAGWTMKGRDIHQRGFIWEKANRAIIASGGSVMTQSSFPERSIIDLVDLADFEQTGK